MLQTTSTVVEVCLYAKLPRGDQEKLEFLSCFQMVGVLFFFTDWFLIFFYYYFFLCSLCQRLGPANILSLLQLSSIYSHILQGICLFKKGDINKIVIQTNAISFQKRNLVEHSFPLATKQKGRLFKWIFIGRSRQKAKMSDLVFAFAVKDWGISP